MFSNTDFDKPKFVSCNGDGTVTAEAVDTNSTVSTAVAASSTLEFPTTSSSSTPPSSNFSSSQSLPAKLAPKRSFWSIRSISHLRSSSCSSVNSTCLATTIWRFLQSVFPILQWLPQYSIRESLFADVITGVTILALHIPQGLAYGRLAGVEPIYGLYVSLFPVIIYSLMGTSRQISIGTFAVVSIACRDVLTNFRIPLDPVPSANATTSTTPSMMLATSAVRIESADLLQLGGERLTPIEVLTTLSLLVGLIQFIIGSLRLGILAILLSDPIISSFVVASSFHVVTSQVFALLGIDSSARAGDKENMIPFVLIRSWYRLFSRLPNANLVTIGLSLGTVTVLMLCKSILEPWLVKRFKLRNFALPIDILCIVGLTVLSYALNLNSQYQVAIIPKISTGFQNLPSMPRFDLIPQLLTSALLLSFVIYVSTFSLEKMFAKRHGYEVRPNQELLALGTCNIVGSFLLCYPCSGSLSRSAVQDRVGGKTQLASLISSFLVVIFILYLSTYLETLPKCALSSIIVVALWSTMAKFRELFYYWRLSKLDGVLWAASFSFVILFGVDRGLLYGLTLSFVILMVRLTLPVFNLKYHVPDSEVYLSRPKAAIGSENDNSDSQKQQLPYPQAEIEAITTAPGIVVFEFHGPLIFLNAETFKSRFTKTILQPINKAQQLKSELEKQQQLTLSRFYVTLDIPSDTSKFIDESEKSGKFNQLYDPSSYSVQNSVFHQSSVNEPTPIHTVIFDCGRVGYLDSKGVEMLIEIASELKESNGIQLLLASCSELILKTLFKGDIGSKQETVLSASNCFVTVHDAVTAAANKNNDSIRAKVTCVSQKDFQVSTQ